jgi:signal-transduction protein with cAMP-binding, CBS, and nucleotidyltransferase domain
MAAASARKAAWTSFSDGNEPGDKAMLVESLLPAARERLVTIADEAPLIQAAELLRTGTDLVVVCGSAGLLAGVITKTDVVSQISHCQGASCITATSLVMTRDVVVCRPGDWLHEVWSKMKERGLKNVPITDQDSRPMGLLNARDALQGLLQEVENEESLLRDYVMGFGYH